ncbi:hypothetical protein CEUSTIGMA_g3290.t1 [Chlamydomonas eustigma]|uniref:S-adenosyl-L-methionine-dependent methyltransferase n=1 Tax=Chlamydomonas eustigma TaxID=1157962 RepID=A0A250WYC8_9CHLO|nr:hypothetical protein CEUSTIGMA_g3290.t1 [Chlamydomonas eustigma]|eukprot:GAX75847.1 hypothetical protein CEUSTIGMA_g3290.t1 [Chlamydomonas eustigma]
MFRTLNQDLEVPNANEDYEAAKIRDELMPFRGWCIRHLPWIKHQMKAMFEHPTMGAPGCVNFIDARTKWFDCAVNNATCARGITQVVIVAAGYDTRAYRLAQPGVTFFEVDLPSASEKKKKLVNKLKLVTSAGRSPVYIAADLSKVDLTTALRNTSFDPSKPALFTIEGH